MPGDILVSTPMLRGDGKPSGARRRTILISYRAESAHRSHMATAELRNVRMDTTNGLTAVNRQQPPRLC